MNEIKALLRSTLQSTTKMSPHVDVSCRAAQGRLRVLKSPLCKGGCQRQLTGGLFSFITPPPRFHRGTSPSQGRGGLDIKLCRHPGSAAQPQRRGGLEVLKSPLCKGGCQRQLTGGLSSFTTLPVRLWRTTTPASPAELQHRGGLNIKLCHHPGSAAQPRRRGGLEC